MITEAEMMKSDDGYLTDCFAIHDGENDNADTIIYSSTSTQRTYLLATLTYWTQISIFCWQYGIIFKQYLAYLSTLLTQYLYIDMKTTL